MNDVAPLPPRHAFSIVVSHDTDTNSYIADVPTLGLGTYGFSLYHAFEMAEEAISLWIETAQEDGLAILVESHPVQVRQVVI
jgi:predicted RNase H-like HicB family nuclease